MDPEARVEALRFAEELETTASRLDGDQAAEMLVRAADIHQHSLGDVNAAISLLRRALSGDGRSATAAVRLRELAELRGDRGLLAEALDHLVKVAVNDVERVRLLAERADLLGVELGRFAEARGLYREVHRLATVDEVRRAALDWAERMDHALAERRGAGALRRDDHAPLLPLVRAHEAELRASARPRSASVARSESIPRGETGVRDASTIMASQVFRRAAGHIDRGERQEARALIDSGLRLDPDSEQGRQLLKRLLRAEGRLAELVDALVALAGTSKSPARGRAALREAAELAAGP
ncbi:hypothetical protein L6R52_39845, partial [Myxococcota bacterium]|nr:hypothetical protein [Myxococcota bacterium]